MKKIVLLSIMLLCSCFAFSQERAENGKGYQGYVELGYSSSRWMVPDGQLYARMQSAHIINGYRFNPYFYMGAGFGFWAIDWDYLVVPFFLNLRTDIPGNRKVSPYLSLDLGAVFPVKENDHKAGTINPTLGANIRLSEKYAIHVGVNYCILWTRLSELDLRAASLGIKVGFSF